MTVRDQQFLDKWAGERDLYRAWGEEVGDRLRRQLAEALAPLSLDAFLRAEVRPRLKEDAKLIEKAFYRNKSYDDPYQQITDKVGTRCVVLLGRDVRTVSAAVEAIADWEISKDRDYEEEQAGNPVAFDYAAVHYVVRPKVSITRDKIVIPAGTPCELQIKTLLQHAYSELTHDTIYKPQINATTKMRRNAAKSMALLEATNDYFEKVQDDVDVALRSVREMTASLSQLYLEKVGFPPKATELEGLLLSAYDAGTSALTEVSDLLRTKPFLADAIRKRVAEKNPIFAQPSVLLAYLEITRSPRLAKEKWPLTPAEQTPLLTDLGEV